MNKKSAPCCNVATALAGRPVMVTVNHDFCIRAACAVDIRPSVGYFGWDIVQKIWKGTPTCLSEFNVRWNGTTEQECGWVLGYPGRDELIRYIFEQNWSAFVTKVIEKAGVEDVSDDPEKARLVLGHVLAVDAFVENFRRPAFAAVDAFVTGLGYDNLGCIPFEDWVSAQGVVDWIVGPTYGGPIMTVSRALFFSQAGFSPTEARMLEFGQAANRPTATSLEMLAAFVDVGQ